MPKNQELIYLTEVAMAHLYLYDYVQVAGRFAVGSVYSIAAPFDVAVTDVCEDGDGLPMATLVAVRS